MQELDDLSPMPFGKHKGTPMQDVPAGYLFYLWTKCDFRSQVKTSQVARYIDANFNALSKEHDDGIWERPEEESA